MAEKNVMGLTKKRRSALVTHVWEAEVLSDENEITLAQILRFTEQINGNLIE